ncbi:MAG: hypothetical protein AAGA78_11070, partial [Pseudomonadota bacterium]
VSGERIALVSDLLEGMAHAGADFTQTFRHLAEHAALPDTLAQDAKLSAWLPRWRAEVDPEVDLTRTNPAIIPRNHQVEAVIAAAVAEDFGPFEAFHEALAQPFDAPSDSPYRAAPQPQEKVKATFCGT